MSPPAPSWSVGRLNGYLPHRWPVWFRPTLVEMRPEPLGPFAASYPVTRDGTVRLVATPGHTPGHLSVVVTTPGLTYLLVGDVSYTQALMLAGTADGVSTNQAVARTTLAAVRAFCASTPTVYLPSHDPDAVDRLARNVTALAVAG
jgi:glyoxylase-like metal-dependent hydrolase (beta-lactamase superfamily II)